MVFADLAELAATKESVMAKRFLVRLALAAHKL